MEIFVALKAGREAEEQAGQQGDEEREAEDAPVERDGEVRREKRRTHRPEQILGPLGEDQPGHAADPGQQHAFRDELAEQPPAVGADGEAHGDLALARHGAGEEEIGQVGAGDQKHEAGEREEQRPGEHEVLPLVGIDAGLRQGHEPDAAAGVVVRIEFRQLGG